MYEYDVLKELRMYVRGNSKFDDLDERMILNLIGVIRLLNTRISSLEMKVQTVKEKTRNLKRKRKYKLKEKEDR